MKHKQNDLIITDEFFKDLPISTIVESPSLADERDIKQRGKDILAQLLDDLETGKIFVDDLGRDNIQRLKACLDKANEKNE